MPMTKKNYTDHEIENLLQSMPPLSDQRSKEAVWKQLKEHNQPVRKKSKPWLPAVISIAALFVLVLFVQSLMGTMSHDESASQNAEMSEGAMDRAVSEEENKESADSADSEETGVATENEESGMSMMTVNESPSSRLLLSSDPLLDTHTVLPFAMDYNAYAVPISLLIPNERIEQDFGTLDVTNLELYKMYAAEVDEEGFGFSDYHPLLGTYEATDRGLEITLPDDHPYDIASAAMGVYMYTLKDVFDEQFDKAYLLNEAGEPLDWDQVGPLVEPSDLSQGNYAFNITQNAYGESFLVPYSRTNYPSFKAALQELTSPDYNVVDPAIPRDIKFEVEETDEQVVVIFEETLTADSVAGYPLQLFIESMLATSAQMDKKLILENWDESIYPFPTETESIIGINPVLFITQ